ncbi:hypothetical protein NIES4073_57420 [Kalymmatonema gypsitolerans NIES-4073]|nr:hypothetical protein NIES4073_57420 [Scytonema sp. NIES-4073]
MTITDNFLKTYTDKTYKHTSLVSHKGTLISFAIDDQRRIYYSVLDLNSTDPEKSPLDVNYWQKNPSELQFPTEIGQVGYSSVGTTSMPIVKKGSRDEAKPGELRPEEIDPFLSTTARLTADAPFQAFSDEKYIYIFRQSVDANHQDNVYLQTSGTRASGANQQRNIRFYRTNASGDPVPVVQDTLLVDRFVLVGTELKLKREVRYKRSRHKTTPLNNKDTLGAEDMENKPFFEPTQELDFVRYLQNGRFSVLLLPTQVADVQRWQIFTHNNNTQLIDSFNIERSKDGFFNTQGTIFYTSPKEEYQNAVFERQPGRCPFTKEPLIPILTKKGYAESTLKFNGSDSYVDLGEGVTVSSQFTIEAWIYLELIDTNYHGFLGNHASSNSNRSASLWVKGLKIMVSFGDGSNAHQCTTVNDVLTVKRWHHVAWTFDSENCQIYVDGELKDLPAENPFLGKIPGDTPIKYIGKVDNFFNGKIDEVRIWNYARSEYDIRANMNFRLVGDEFGLLGYWRFDEGGGTRVFDQTAHAHHGTISGGAEWITSDAPIGERPGIQRISFQFQGRTVESGLASLLYYQQEQAKTGYDETSKPMKQSARVLLAGATKDATEEAKYIGVLDFAVSRDGTLAQIPDNIDLGTPLEDNKSEILKQIQALEVEETELQERINKLSSAGLGEHFQGSGTDASDWFGCSVAISGDWALVGADGKDTFAGAAYVFHFENNQWIEKQKLQAQDQQVQEADRFGCSVAISGDWALVGAYEKDTRTGAAYVFHLENGEWKEKQKLQAQDKQANDLFGYSVVISGDWALVGADGKDNFTGAAYVFHLENGEWKEKQQLQAQDKLADDRFGDSVAIIEDWALVGAYGKDNFTGAAYVFHLENGEWKEKQKLQAQDKQADDRFGDSVAIIEDWALVGADGKDNFTGAAYVFHLENGEWKEKQKLQAQDKQAADYFGDSVVIIEDWALVGAIGKDSFTGAAYVFHLENNQWKEKQKLQAQDKLADDYFGRSVVITEDWALVGAERKDSGTGAVYTFAYNLPALQARLEQVQAEIERLNQLFDQSPIPLSLLYLDPMGLTVSGGLLGFASTKDTPQLFDSATGQLALYFRGENDEFFAAYYDSNTAKAQYQLDAKTGKLTLVARSAIGEMNQTQITVADGSSAENCKVTITNAATDITETWNEVPREAKKFADVLNGQAQDYEYEEQASTGKPAYVLQNGSLHFIAIPNDASGEVKNATVEQPYSSALSCNWIADSPGQALSFNGNYYISVTDTNKLPQLDAKGDVTLEAWVNPSTVNSEAQVIYHYSDNCQYALSLKNQDTNTYKIKAGVDNRLLQTVGSLSKDNWNHLAVVFNQSYALQFDGGDYLDAGTDSTLNVTEDLTIEVVLEVDDTNSRGILSKGVLQSGLSQQYVPYALSLQSGKIVFSFENDEGQQQKIESSTSLQANKVYKIAITRQKQTETTTSSDPTYGGLVSESVGDFSDIISAADLDSKSGDIEKVMKADFVDAKKRGKQLQDMDSPNPPDTSTPGLPTGTQVTQWIEVKIYIDGKLDNNKALPTATCGRNSQPLEIGKVGKSYFKGSIGEVRLWNRALPQGEINQNIVGAEEGLLAWWRIEENEGNIAYDSKSNNHAQIKGAQWVKNPDPNGSRLVIYANGIPMATEATDAIPWQTKQFTLGALKKDSSFTNYFSGTLEEVRIWKVARTQEQIQDNLFTRLKGEKENLIANYTFDGEDEDEDTELLDSSLLSNHLPLGSEDSKSNFILSTAPISNDIAQVRSALAGIETQFNDIIDSRPAVQEYADTQYDIDGNMIAVMKRCYAYIKNNQWHLLTGYKVGNLITEWISQAQFDPQIIGFIEGAPPVPSENLTVGAVSITGNYGGVTSLEVVEAENVMYKFSNSKEEGSDQAFEAEGKLGAGFDTHVLVAPFGFGISFRLKGEFKAGIGYQSQSSKSWSNDQSFALGRNVSKNTSVSLGGSWESPDVILNPNLGQRYLPSNMGFALVQSETADVFALRLAHNGALVSFRFQPNPDIPKDVNLIPFPINPRYTKQGTLDGAVGYNDQGKVQDPEYANAKDYGEYSYFKPKEAYALKKRIKQEEEELKAYYRNFDTGVDETMLSGGSQPGADFYKELESKYGLSIGNTSSGNSVPKDGSLAEKYAKRNLVNTYVWTADGGFYAESTEVTEVKQETTAGTFSSSSSFGGGFEIELEAPVVFEASMKAMNGGHLNVTKSKTQESQNSFRLDVTVNTPGDLQKYDDQGNPVYENDSPKIVEGKVDAYRFMSFYLEPVKENFEDLFNKVVDPEWLNEDNNPNALAMRQAQQVEKTPPCWRVFHRVTFISRILPEIPANTAPPLEQAMRAAELESNWQLIQRLEPLVRHKTNNYGEFSAAVGKAVDTYLPELKPHKPEIINYMALYFGIEGAI